MAQRVNVSIDFPATLHTWTGAKGEAQPISTMQTKNLRGLLRKFERFGTDNFKGIYAAIRAEITSRGKNPDWRPRDRRSA